MGSPTQGGMCVRIQHLGQILTSVSESTAPIWAAWICVTNFGNADLSILIHAIATLPRGNGINYPCPRLSCSQFQHQDGYGASQLACLFQIKVRIVPLFH